MNALPSHLSPEPTDSEDVVSALETADIFWTKGDADEAMRWLKRAAESASDAGNDDRALAIARTVADLKTAPVRAVEAPTTAHKLSRPPPPSAARQAPSPPSAVRLGTSESSEVRRAPPHLPSPSAPVGDGSAPVKGPISQKAPPPTPKPRESVSSPTASHRHSSMPPAPTPKRPAASESVNPEPIRAAASTPAKQQAPGASTAAATIPEPARPTPVAPQPSRTQPVAVASAVTAEAPVPAARRTASASSAPKEPNRAPTAATAYRAVTVFVRPEGRDGDKLEVIVAKPGQPVPAGAEPAMLVPTRRGALLLG